MTSEPHVVERWVYGTSPDDIWSGTPHVSRESAKASLEMLQQGGQSLGVWEDMRVFKQTTITEEVEPE